MGVISCAAINNEIVKYNNYIEPDPELTTDLIANTSTTRGPPVMQPQLKIDQIAYAFNPFNGWYLYVLLAIFSILWIASLIKSV